MPTIKGNDKANELEGDSSDLSVVTNYIYGYGGNDILKGGFRANNFIWGGTGNDTLSAGPFGINRLYGEDGDDYIIVYSVDTDNRLFGGAGNDILIAGIGGNFLDGGTGEDLMEGSDGPDVFIVDNAGDFVVEERVQRYAVTDTVRSKVSYDLNDFARIELIETTNAAKTTALKLAGSAVGQTIKGNAGNNVLDGEGGNDILVGGLGADTLIGGIGRDTASYVFATSGVTANLTKAYSNTGEAKGDTFKSVENLAGSSFSDRLYGNKAANKLTGGVGNDYLSGGEGNDTLRGDAGNDKLNGGLGTDTLTGGSGKDLFVFSTTLGSASVDTITDFKPTDDSIRLENAIFTKLSKVGILGVDQFVANKSGIATDKLDRIIYETDTGKLSYDADGSGSGKAVHFATLGAGLTITAADFWVI